MENLSPSARAYKRRKLASSQDELVESPDASDAGGGWNLTGLVGRIFQGGSKAPEARKNGVNGKAHGRNGVARGGGELDELEEHGSGTEPTIQNGSADLTGGQVDVGTDVVGEEQEEDPVITLKRRGRGRPQERRKQDDSARLGLVGDSVVSMENGVNGGRILRGSSRNSVTPLKNGVEPPTKRRDTPGRRKSHPAAKNEERITRGGDIDDHINGTAPTENPIVKDTTDTQFNDQNGSADLMDVDEMEDCPPQTRSSGRQRKKPRKYSIEVEISETTRAKCGSGELVGILTPSKRRKGNVNRRKKTVAFEGSGVDVGEEELGFKDIQSSEKMRNDRSGDLSNGCHAKAIEEEDVQNAFSTETDLLEDMDLAFQTEDTLMTEVSATIGQVEEVDDLPEFAGEFRKICQEHGLEDMLPLLSKVILEQLTSKRRIPLFGLDDEFSKVHQLVKQTVVAGEGNSMLILGARGTGKTTFVEMIISDLAKDHQADFHVIRLNGFIHTDDRLALKEIWRQLGREMETEDEFGGNPISYADTLSSLLALLSHPEELSGEETDAAAKSVIFVMDEFDLFAAHPRQTLLYNLFDISQARKAPIAVIGLSTKVDVAESLEKRVKSRFSHRYVHLPMPKNLSIFEAICRAGLEVNTDGRSQFEGKEGQVLLEGWSQFLKGLFEQDRDFISFLQRIFYQTKSVQEFFTACTSPIVALSLDVLPAGKTFLREELSPPESKLHMLEGLSSLELSLLIAAARLNVILDQDNCNFNLAFEEYQDMVSRAKIQSFASGAAAAGSGSKVWSRQLSLGAWERLGEYDLIVPATGASLAAGSAGTRDASRDGRMFKVDIALEEIWPSVPGMSSVMSRWCKEI